MNIRDLRAGDKKVSVEGTITGLTEPKTVNLKTGGSSRVASATLSDETGAMSLQLWNGEINLVKVGDRVKIENGFVGAYQGVNRLQIGQYGKLHKVESTPFKPVAEQLTEARVRAIVQEEISKLIPTPKTA